MDPKNRWRQLARATWKSTTPTDSLTGKHTLRELEKRQARAVLDLASRLAAGEIGAGGTAADATAIALRIADHFGVNVQVDTTFTSVTMTHQRDHDEDPISILRTVRQRTSDYQRLARYEQLADAVAAGRLTLDEALERLAEITRSPRTYRQWLVTLAAGVLGAAVAVLFGGNFWEALVAGVVTLLIERLQFYCDRPGVPLFFLQFLGAALCGAVALVFMALRYYKHTGFEVRPSLVVTAGMVAMLAGMSLMTAARDAIDGYYITSIARGMEATIQTAGLVIGLLATLWVGFQLGVPSNLSPAPPVTTGWVVALVAAALISISFAVMSHLGPRSLLPAAALGMAAVAVQRLATPAMNSAAAAGVAALVVALVSQLLTKRWAVPQLALLNAGIVSLVPGMYVYRGLLALARQSQGQFVDATESPRALLTALLVAVALAMGAAFGTMMGRPFSLPADRGRRRSLLKSLRQQQAHRD